MKLNRGEQRDFLHGGSMSLERLARSLFGEKHYGSANITDSRHWKKFYLASIDVIQASIFSSIGAIDHSHKEAIARLIASARSDLNDKKGKDQVHAVLIVFLFRLVFLLMGREPYSARGQKRNFGTFRTLTYSQTEEQLSWLLQGAVQRSAKELGFDDSFSADMAFHHWAQNNRRNVSDRSAYVCWVETNFPEVYRSFR